MAIGIDEMAIEKWAWHAYHDIDLLEGGLPG